MKICNLGSGSKGNCTYIESNGYKLLIDAGLKYNDIVYRLSLLDVKPNEINSILITHEHCDHIRSVDLFIKNFNTKVYLHNDIASAVNIKNPKIKYENINVFSDAAFDISDLVINPIRLPHDSLACFGFSICENSKKFSILTDLGHTNSEILSSVRNSTLLFLEANHDESLLKANIHYPAKLKRRILSSKGHLSNTACANAILEVAPSGVKQVVLSHLSEENNTPSLAYKTVCNVLLENGVIEGTHIHIDVAHQHRPGVIFNLK